VPVEVDDTFHLEYNGKEAVNGRQSHPGLCFPAPRQTRQVSAHMCSAPGLLLWPFVIATREECTVASPLSMPLGPGHDPLQHHSPLRFQLLGTNQELVNALTTITLSSIVSSPGLSLFHQSFYPSTL